MLDNYNSERDKLIIKKYILELLWNVVRVTYKDKT